MLVSESKWENEGNGLVSMSFNECGVCLMREIFKEVGLGGDKMELVLTYLNLNYTNLQQFR